MRSFLPDLSRKFALSTAMRGGIATGALAGIGCLAAGTAALAGPSAAALLIIPAIWPAEAALRGNRRDLWWTTAAAALASAGAGAVMLGSIPLAAGSAIFAGSATTIAAGYAATVFTRIQTLREQAAQRIGAANAHAQWLSEASGELVTRIDRQGMADFVSQSSQRLIGREPNTLQGRGLLDVLHVQDRVTFLKAISDCAAKRVPVATSARLRVRDQGDLLWRSFAVTLHPPLKRRELVAVWQDNSRQRDLEQRIETQELDMKRDELARNRRIAEAGHELRTPLNAIVGFSQLLSTGTAGDLPNARQREYVGLIEESGQHLLRVVTDLLDAPDAAKRDCALEVASFDIEELTRATIAMMQPQAEQAGLALVCDMRGDFEGFSADRRACRQILINLLTNAIKFSNAGTEVCLSLRRHGRFVKLRCIDQGIGMTPEFLARIGEPYRQARDASAAPSNGSGLGLSLVRNLLDAQGGTIAFESTPGTGTTVTAMLPMRGRLAQPQPANVEPRMVRLPASQTPALAPSNTNEKIQAAATGPSRNEGESSARVSA